MIQKLREELAAYLAAKGVPVTVELNEAAGSAKAQATFGRSRITLEHEPDRQGDSFEAPRAQRIANPPRYVRQQALVLRIYAQSGKAGALLFEHQRLANDILDFVLVGLSEIASKRQNRWTPNQGGFVSIADLAESERPGGAVYELALSFDRGVFEAASWASPTEPNVTLVAGQLTSKTNVTSANADPDLPAPTPEVSCGG